MRARQDERLRFDVALRLPRDPRSVRLARRITSAGLAELGVTPACADDINLALSEACTNVVRHAEADDDYEVRVSVDTATCHVTVTDYGRGFDPDLLARGWPSDQQANGRGLALMRALVDQLELTTGTGEGTVVHLTKEIELDGREAIRRFGA